MSSARLPERLRESIEEEIATGRLLPGTRLDEVELAKRFGVSRTPIREALRLLLGEGLVETRPQRGAVVAQVTPQRLIEMFEVMAELEAMCARLAARRMSDAELAEVEAAHEAGRRARRGCVLLRQRALPLRHLRGLAQHLPVRAGRLAAAQAPALPPAAIARAQPPAALVRGTPGHPRRAARGRRRQGAAEHPRP